VTQIEHVAIWTPDIERLVHFYMRYFGARAGVKYMNPAKGFESRFLSFDGGMRLELMRSDSLRLPPIERGAERPGLTHLALSVGSEEGVDRLTSQLRRDGHEILDGPRRTGDGYYESVVLDPDGNRLELTAGAGATP